MCMKTYCNGYKNKPLACCAFEIFIPGLRKIIINHELLGGEGIKMIYEVHGQKKSTGRKINV